MKATGYGVTVSVQALIAEAKTQADRANYRAAYLENRITWVPAQVRLDATGHVRELYLDCPPGDQADTDLHGSLSLTAGPWPPSTFHRPLT